MIGCVMIPSSLKANQIRANLEANLLETKRHNILNILGPTGELDVENACSLIYRGTNTAITRMNVLEQGASGGITLNTTK